jgi:hypothetical protein
MTRQYSDAVIVSTLAAVTIAGVGLGYLLGAVAGLGTTSITYPDEKPDTTIRLEQASADAPCLPLEPQPLRRQKKKSVTWHIINACRSSVYVRIDNVRLHNDDGTLGTPDAGFFAPPAPQTTSLPPSLVPVDLPATVNKDVKEKKIYPYKYRVSISSDGTSWPLDRMIDPDIDIWP